MVFLEKACGVKFLKYGGAVYSSRVVGMDPQPPFPARVLPIYKC